jgi:putative serine protease PepD
MMIRAVAVLCLIAAAAPPAAGDDLKDLARDAATSVLKLRVLDVSGREIGSGTGFFVSDDGLVVTNRHVIEAAHRIEAVPADGPAYAVRGVVAQDAVNDLAILRLDAARVRPLRLSAGAVPEPGERVVVLGGPLGLAGSLSEGIVAAIRDPSEVERRQSGRSPLLQITAAISPGSSGSPVMKLDGEVVGVVVSQFGIGQNLNFAVPVAALQPLMERARTSADVTPLGSVSGAAGGSYLRNLLISAFFFIALYVALKRMK